eukprot:8392907-Pyramimonas_sp.AAC.1
MTEGLSALLALHSLCAMSTMWPAGGTYYGNSTSEVFDIFVMPRERVSEVSWRRALARSSWRLQSYSLSKLWDRGPVELAVPLE